MEWTQRLNAALDYLEVTTDREPDLEHAAALANCSLFHFLRMFEVVTGMTAGDYSRRCRLSRAAIDLGLCCEWNRPRDEFTYLIGVDLPATGGNLPAGTRTVALPAATYAVFESIGPMPHSIQKVWLRAFNEWFPTSGWEHAGTPDFEVYPAFAPDDPRGDVTSPLCYSEVWIPLRKR